MDHSECGRGDEYGCPVDSDCGCRGTDRQSECASIGCGFCQAAAQLFMDAVDNMRG